MRMGKGGRWDEEVVWGEISEWARGHQLGKKGDWKESYLEGIWVSRIKKLFVWVDERIYG